MGVEVGGVRERNISRSRGLGQKYTYIGPRGWKKRRGAILECTCLIVHIKFMVSVVRTNGTSASSLCPPFDCVCLVRVCRRTPAASPWPSTSSPAAPATCPRTDRRALSCSARRKASRTSERDSRTGLLVGDLQSVDGCPLGLVIVIHLRAVAVAGPDCCTYVVFSITGHFDFRKQWFILSGEQTCELQQSGIHYHEYSAQTVNPTLSWCWQGILVTYHVLIVIQHLQMYTVSNSRFNTVGTRWSDFAHAHITTVDLRLAVIHYLWYNEFGKVHLIILPFTSLGNI